jgi:hypothetical protein
LLKRESLKEAFAPIATTVTSLARELTGQQAPE